MKKQFTLNELIEKAKEKIIQNYGEQPNRRWLEAHTDSYGNPNYRIQMIVWEGSNAKGYIIINHGTGRIRAYGVNDKLLWTSNFKRSGIITRVCG